MKIQYVVALSLSMLLLVRLALPAPAAATDCNLSWYFDDGTASLGPWAAAGFTHTISEYLTAPGAMEGVASSYTELTAAEILTLANKEGIIWSNNIYLALRTSTEVSSVTYIYDDASSSNLQHISGAGGGGNWSIYQGTAVHSRQLAAIRITTDFVPPTVAIDNIDLSIPCSAFMAAAPTATPEVTPSSTPTITPTATPTITPTPAETPYSIQSIPSLPQPHEIPDVDDDWLIAVGHLWNMNHLAGFISALLTFALLTTKNYLMRTIFMMLALVSVLRFLHYVIFVREYDGGGGSSSPGRRSDDI
jgi:hypothetical protein